MPVQKKLINIISLSVISGGNAVFPVVIFPYYLTVLGVELFSKVVTIESIILVLVIFSLYSFDIIGLKKISGVKVFNPEQRNEVFWSILFARLVILVSMAAPICILLLIVAEDYFSLFLFWLLFPLGIIMQSAYYYQAVEENLALAGFVFFSRVAACICAFAFVKKPDDLIFAVLVISGSYLASGLLSVFYFLYSNRALVAWSTARLAPSLIKEGGVVFIGSASVILYRGANVLILTWFSGNPAAISLYAIAEKFIKLIQALVFPLSQYYTPRVIKDLSARKSGYMPFLWTNTKLQVFMSLGAVIFLVVVALVESLYSSRVFSTNIVLLIAVMAISVPCGVANFMMGFVGLNALGRGGEFTKITTTVGALSVMLASLLAWLFDDVGVAIAYGFAEALILLWVVCRYKLFGDLMARRRGCHESW